MPGIVEDENAAMAQQQQQQQQTEAHKPTKNQRQRAKKKSQKRDVQPTSKATETENIAGAGETNAAPPVQPVARAAKHSTKDASIAPAAAQLAISTDDPLYSQFAGVFAKFQDEAIEEAPPVKKSEKTQVFFNDDNVQSEDEEAETKRRITSRARKAANKLSVAELKAVVRKPEVVEWTDVSSVDPKLLVNIKSIRNIVPVPSHWQLKREYLSSKRGVEKQHFRLPQFIAETGIAEMRQTSLDEQAGASLKQQQRDKVNPKLNRLDIDYQKLFEAFFRRQTKPHLTRYGEVYYEGKEHETNLRHLRPGFYSDNLREALNMPPEFPPPWLINQQAHGVPPSYQGMKIPGVNAAIPPGGKWGYEPGQYGKPPVESDLTMKPLWGGDLFGSEQKKKQESRKTRPEPPVSRALWGELQSLQAEDEAEKAELGEEEDEEEEEEEENEEEGREVDIGGTGLETPFDGIATPTARGSAKKDIEFDLRKQRPQGTETEELSRPRAAGQVLQERAIRAEGFFGGERAYDLKGTQVRDIEADTPERGTKRKAGDLDVSVDVDALEREDRLSKQEIRKRYDETRERDAPGNWRGKVNQDDLSNMIAEENAKRLKKNHDSKRGR